MTRTWVTLHRVGSDSAAPLDSVQTDARGSYNFRYARFGDERALYFATSTFGGVTYFTPPLRANTVAGEPAEIVVFDTTTGGVPINIRGRHLIVSAAEANELRSVVEVFELANDSSVTRVSPLPSSPATWTATLPEGARNARVSDGDVPAEAVSFVRGQVRVVSPFPPGVKQLAYSYSLPTSRFPLSIPIGAQTDLYEVLIEDPRGTVRGAQLAESEPVTIEGRRFRRFVAQDVAPSAVAVVDVPPLPSGWDPRYVVGLTLVLGGTMVLALARAFRRV